MASPKGAKGLPETDYVELYNTTDHTISLKGWSFIYDGTVIRLPDVPLAANRYAVLYRKGKSLPLNKKVLGLGFSNFPLNMSDEGKQLALKDPSGTVIHSYTYPKAEAGRSIERSEGDKWHLSTDPRGGTPGEENSVAPSVPTPKPDDPATSPDTPSAPPSSPSDTVKSGDIVINEVMASPKGAKGLPETDYVELYNTTDHTISLKGWSFIYDGTVIRLPDVPLAANRYAVLYRKGKSLPLNKKVLGLGFSNFPLNMSDEGKQLTLKDSSGTVIHSYTYPKAKAGRSIERGEGDKWHLSSDPRGGTPGEENSVAPSVPTPKPDDPATSPDTPSAPPSSPSDTVKSGDIVINEVMASPKGAKGLPETDYVELYNTTDHTISLKGWSFIYDGTVIRLPDVPLAANRYAVLYRKGKSLPLNKKVLGLGFSNFPLNMSDEGKQLTLKDSSGTVIHSYTYPKAKAGRSIERSEGDKWHLSSDPRGGTPGEENSEGAPDKPDKPEREKSSPGDVLINEVMADPHGLTKLPATEYVELHNTTDHEINLEGWAFVYDKTSIPLPDAELPAGGYAVLYKAGREISVADGAAEVAVKRFPANMINAGKPLALKDPSGTVIHSYTYPKAKAGRSIERGEGDTWHLSTDPRGGTPGEENSEDTLDKPDKPEKEKSSPGDVLINEVMADSRGLTKLPATEYVELHNTTDHEINLEGWTFVYDKTSIPLPDAELPAGGYAVLYKAGREISVADGAAEVAVKRFPANMINAGKPLALKDPSGTVIHSYAYPKAKAGRSIERGEGDTWHLSSDPRGGTPGEENSEGVPDKPDKPEKEKSSPGDVLINEVMADPHGLTKLPATEYVELHNTTDHEINLEGWTFVYDKTSIPLPDVELSAGGYAVLYKAGREISVADGAAEVAVKRFPANMVNAGKLLTLKDPSGTVIHSYTYPKAKAGRSIERGEGDKWHLSSDPRGGTPGEENSEGAPDKPDEPEKEKSSPGDVLINEVMADPRGLTKLPATEYVELHNTTDHEINLEGWAFVYDKTSIPLPDTELPAGGYAVLYKAGREISVADGAAEVAVKRFPANMINAGKPLALKDPSGTVIHSYTYPKAKAGRSIERGEGDKWHLSFDPRGGTPGEENSEGAPDKPDKPEKEKSSPGDVLINEVMADPRGLTKLPATEYVELHNTTDHEINLEGWAFVYDKTSIPLPDAELPAGGYAVLYKAGREISVADGAAEVAVRRFPANMINTGKPLALKDPSGTVIHSYTYPKAKAGRSIERGEGDKWHLSSDPRGGTPGEENSEGAPDKPDEPDEPNKPNEPDATGQVEPREIILNEILFDPQPRGSEYIELYNRSDRTLSTHGLAIALRKSDGHLGTRHSLTSLATTLAPGDYLVLTSDPNGVTSLIRTPALDAIRRFKLPALNNQGATIVLLRTADSTVVDEVTYSAKWHSSAVKIRRGVALERISPDGSSQEAANWTSASSETGYGTPGYKNSQSGTSSQIEEGATISEPEYNASTRDYLIRYRMDKPDYRCQMAVYSSNGQKMAVIANNQLLTSEGEIRWDGAGLSPGVYVFYVELYHPDGSSQHIRKPLLVH
ncbi:lamin tail domain-containing protein [Tannerella serpentiformis]|nr:lamin tail domain-containing protein [Tannerella serpentiformis]